MSLYKIAISNAYKSQYNQQQYGMKQVMEEVSKLSDKIVKSRELLLEGIDAGEYRFIKSNCEEQVYKLEAKLAELLQNLLQ